METALCFVQSPGECLNRIIEKRPLRLALWGYFSGAASFFLWLNLDGGLSAWELFFGISVFFSAALLAGYLAAAIVHLVIELSGGKGSAAGLFSAMGIAAFAPVILIPLGMVSLFLRPYLTVSPLAELLAAVFLKLYLVVRGTAANYKISAGKALAAVLLPAAALAGIAVALVIALLAGLAAMAFALL